MNTKELVQQGYDFFGKGDMEGFLGKIIHYLGLTKEKKI